MGAKALTGFMRHITLTDNLTDLVLGCRTRRSATPAPGQRPWPGSRTRCESEP
jgi:hypothetical protein